MPEERLSRHPGAPGTSPYAATSDRTEKFLQAIDELGLGRQHAVFKHVCPSIAIERMCQFARDFS